MHQRQEAAFELWALDPAAEVPPRVELGPGRALFRQSPDFGTVAEFGGLFPLANDLKVGCLLQPGQYGLPVGVVDFLAAGVVAAAFHVAYLHRTLEVLL